MPAVRTLLLLFVFLAAASAADLKVKVVDPQSAAVSGAQVIFSANCHPNQVVVATTSAEGIATFPSLGFEDRATGECLLCFSVRVLAPGFAPRTVDLDIPVRSVAADQFTIQLHLATASEIVVVTATRTPTPAEETGASISTLESGQLETMHPIGADDTIRFLPGAVVNTAGQRGGLSSLFVRGGESTYNKVIVDGVAVDNPGETFDFGTLPLTQADRVEFLRGTQSTLYGSDAMTSVVQVWTRTGSTQVPEFRFGADGGNFGTANGYASLAGARGRYDYNFFGSQFNSTGSGVNDDYSDSLAGANLGAAITDRIGLRFRFRHSNSYTGLPGEWNFNGDPLLAPDPSETAHLNSLLGSVELSVAEPSGWQHRLTVFDYLYRYTDVNLNSNPASYDDFPDTFETHVNRVGVEYQGDYSERAWAHTTFGYRIENETGVVNDLDFPPPAPGQRLDQDVYLQQQLTLGRLSVIAGGRFVHSSAYGNTGVPRVALTLLALRGGEVFSGTRLRFSYATGFMEPALYQTFGDVAYDYAPNHGLLPERTRAFEAGFEQKLFGGRWALNAIYFNNLFHDQIEAIPTPTGEYEFFNLEQSFAQGAEIELQGRLSSRLSLTTAYTYTSTEILENPECTRDQRLQLPLRAGRPAAAAPQAFGNHSAELCGKAMGSESCGQFCGFARRF